MMVVQRGRGSIGQPTDSPGLEQYLWVATLVLCDPGETMGSKPVIGSIQSRSGDLFASNAEIELALLLVGYSRGCPVYYCVLGPKISLRSNV